MSEPSELERTIAELQRLARPFAPGSAHNGMVEARHALKVLREMAADFERAGKRCDALEKMLVAYRMGRPPAEATFSALEKHSREWLDAARERWRVKP